jgi:hypothetical protein
MKTGQNITTTRHGTAAPPRTIAVRVGCLPAKYTMFSTLRSNLRSSSSASKSNGEQLRWAAADVSWLLDVATRTRDVRRSGGDRLELELKLALLATPAATIYPPSSLPALRHLDGACHHGGLTRALYLPP